MKYTWALYIIGYSDDPDRTEHVVDEFHGLKSREDAIALKRSALDSEFGAWVGCDVYTKICVER